MGEGKVRGRGKGQRRSLGDGAVRWLSHLSLLSLREVLQPFWSFGDDDDCFFVRTVRLGISSQEGKDWKYFSSYL